MTALTDRPRRRVPTWLIALIVVLGGVAVGIGGSRLLSGHKTAQPYIAPPPEVNQKTLSDAVQGLCQTQTLINSGDTNAARGPFINRSHVFLHSLAAKVQGRDRDSATDLLVAMYRVEDLLLVPTGLSQGSAIASPAAGESPSQLMTDLMANVQRSATVIGLQSPPCGGTP